MTKLIKPNYRIKYVVAYNNYVHMGEWYIVQQRTVFGWLDETSYLTKEKSTELLTHLEKNQPRKFVITTGQVLLILLGILFSVFFTFMGYACFHRC